MTLNPKPNLLIVDDETDLRELLIEQIGTDQFQIHTAMDGVQGLKIIREAYEKDDPIDTVLSDINMPKLNGLDLLAEVRKLGLETPFVFLTGYGDKEKAVRALRLGAMDFLEKPYEVTHLLRAVTEAANYGMLLRSMEIEIKSAMETAGKLPSQQTQDYIRARKALIMMKKQIQATAKKAS